MDLKPAHHMLTSCWGKPELDRAFAAIHMILLDDHCPAIGSEDLFRLPAQIPTVGCVLFVGCAAGIRDSQHMASQEFLRGDQIRIVGVGLFVARPDQRFGRGDKQHLSTSAKLIVQGEQARHTWFSTGTHCPGTVLRKKARRKGFRGCIHTASSSSQYVHRSSLMQTFNRCRRLRFSRGRSSGGRLELPGQRTMTLGERGIEC